MSVNGIGQDYYHNYTSATKNTKNVNGTDKADSAQELSEVEEMELFKKEFYDEIAKIPQNRTITNVAINISEEAFKNMKDNPEYRAKIMSVLQRDLTSSFAPLKASLLITVGATEKDYRGDSWSVGYDSEFFTRSKNSFYKRTSDKKDRQKEIMEKYLQKRAQVKKQQEMLNEKMVKQDQERNRLLQSWNNERQLAKASDAYEANFMTETVADGSSLLG